MVSRAVGNRPYEFYFYTGFSEIPSDPQLFGKPEGITITEAKQ